MPVKIEDIKVYTLIPCNKKRKVQISSIIFTAREGAGVGGGAETTSPVGPPGTESALVVTVVAG